LNECHQPRSAGCWLHRKRDLHGGRVTKVDCAYLFENPRHSDVRQQSPGIFSVRNVRFLPVVGRGDVQNSADTLGILVGGKLDARGYLISAARNIRDGYRNLPFANHPLNSGGRLVPVATDETILSVDDKLWCIHAIDVVTSGLVLLARRVLL
jgi:hypothetical protein